MNRVTDYLRNNAVRVYGFLVALVALIVHYVPNLPSDLVLGLVAAVLALFGGEAVQRVENRKTVEAANYGEAEALDTL